MKKRDRVLDADADDRNQCIICCERIKCVVFNPCGHIESCAKCALGLVKPGGVAIECLICKARVCAVAFARV